MISKTSRLITIAILAALLLSMGLCAFAADDGAAFTIYTIDGCRAPIGGASFSLFGSDGSPVTTAVTGASGYATMSIPAAFIADEGATGFTLVQTGVPSGYEVTDNNWAVTVTASGGKASVDIAADGLWDTIFDWIDGSVVTGSEYAGGTLTVANIVRYYEIPECTKTVKGLSYTQMQGYTSDYELTDASGRAVANGHAIGFAVQGDETFKAPIVFNVDKLPAGTYALKETSVTEIRDMGFEGSKFLNNGKLVVGASGSGEAVYAEYTVPAVYVPPVREVSSPAAAAPVTPDNGTAGNDGEKTDAPDKNARHEDKDTGEKSAEVEIAEQKVPTAASPGDGGAKAWVIAALASAVLIAAAVVTAKKIKYNR